MIAVRIRTPVGTYRLNDVALNDTFQHIKDRLLSEHNAKIQGSLSLEAKSSKSSAVPDSMTVQEAGLSNGHMLHADVAAGTTMNTGHQSSSAPSNSGARITTIGKDGSIVVTEVANTWASSLFGLTLTTKNGEKNTATVLNGKKRVGIYFSAHWVCFFYIYSSIV